MSLCSRSPQQPHRAEHDDKANDEPNDTEHGHDAAPAPAPRERTGAVVAAMTGPEPHVRPPVNLVAGGDFLTAGGVSANCIARWNGTSWSALGSGMNAFSANALATLPNGDLVAGGVITVAAPLPAFAGCLASIGRLGLQARSFPAEVLLEAAWVLVGCESTVFGDRDRPARKSPPLSATTLPAKAGETPIPGVTSA